MTQCAATLGRNQILGALPEAAQRALEPQLEYVRLASGRTLHEPGEPLRHVYFPVSGMVGLLHLSRAGASVELALVGCEGMVGLGPLLGQETPSTRALVMAAGAAYRLPLARARSAFAEDRHFQAGILRFAQAVMEDLAQTAICNLRHRLEQHLCRWLLLCLDRQPSCEIVVTHEAIAQALGVRRQGVTEAAKRLEDSHIIGHSRGRITVLDRPALEMRACECYRALRAQLAG